MTATLEPAALAPPAPSAPPGPLDQRARALGLPSATALVIGSIIGTGVFTMPAVMAEAGTSSLITLGLIAVGALLLGVLFGQMTKRVPTSDGGMYAYTRHEFGEFAGYLTAWCYWITCWAGNAAIVASWVGYVKELFGIESTSGWVSFPIALVGLWLPAAINLYGIRNMAVFQNITAVLKFLPLLAVATFGWFFVSSANFGAFNATGGSLYDAVNLAAGVALFSFIGVECASIAAARVKDPRRNVGRASVIGTAASGLLYVAVTAAVMGLVPQDQLVGNETPFVGAFDAMFDGGWLGELVALIAVISGIGALNGWTMVTAEMPYVAAKEGLFLPAFAKEDRNGTPWFGIVVSTAVASGLMAFSYASEVGLDVFTYLVYLSVVTVAIPYFLSASAQLAFLVSRRRKVQGWALARDLTVATVGGLFALWVTFAAGYQSVYQSMLLLLLGIPLYGFLKARRERLGLTPEPIEHVDEVLDLSAGL